MQLPFTHEDFLAVFGDYNRALWPVVVALWLATLGALLRLDRDGPKAGKILAGLLAIQWAWAGAVYHLAFFRRINPAALFFGLAFLLESALLIWRGVLRPSVVPPRFSSAWNKIGVALMLYALAYPGVGLLFGLHYPRLPTFGVPCPTVILTAGWLLLIPKREARLLGWIPVLWAGIGGSAAFVLRVRADVVLALAGVLLLVYMVTPVQSTRRGAT